MIYGRTGLNAGMVASRRSMQLTSAREPLRHNLFDKLIEYWPMCETGGARIGTILGKKPAPSTGVVGCASGLGTLAASFLGSTNPYLTLPSDSDVQLGNIDWTMSAWCLISVTGNNHAFFGKDDAASGREVAALRVSTAQTLINQIFDGTSTSKAVASSVATVAALTWTHLTANFDHNTGLPSVIINGTKVTGAAASGAPGVSSTALGLGGDARAGSTVTVQGQMMRAGLWKRVLTDDEIAYLYNGGRGRDFPWI